MPNLLSHLNEDERVEFLKELNYLNLEEIRSFCSEHGIPYKVLAEFADGTVKTTQDTDRKPIVLARVRHFLTTGDPGQPTILPAKIVRSASPPIKPTHRDRLYYRWYAKEHDGIIRTLRELTDGQFRDGAVARVLAMDFWTRGKAPTLAEFARAWTTANADRHLLLTAEYAYLTDLQHKRTGDDWKSLRKAKAQSALQTLRKLTTLKI